MGETAARGDEYDAIIAEAERSPPGARPGRPRSMVAVSVYFLIAGLFSLFAALVIASSGGEFTPGETTRHGPTTTSVEYARGPLPPLEQALVAITLIDGVLLLAAAVLLLDKAAGWWLGMGHGILGLSVGVAGGLAWLLLVAGRDLPWWGESLAASWLVTLAMHGLVLFFLTRPRAMRYYSVGRFAAPA